MSNDMSTLSLSTLYEILLNHEQSRQLKKNLVKESREMKSSPLALISESSSVDTSTPFVYSLPPVVITEIDSSEDIPESDLTDFDESLALLT